MVDIFSVFQVAFGEAGEKPEYFEFFCEKATMALFVNALRLGPAIKTQVTSACHTVADQFSISKERLGRAF